MLNSITALLPAKNKVVLWYACLSLALSIALFVVGLYVYLSTDLERKTRLAKTLLTDQMADIFEELKHITDDASGACYNDDITQLRRATFNSPTFKELGLFGDNFRVYCSNFGMVNIPIYSTIVARIESSNDRKTVSLMRSNTLGDSTFFAFYQGENGIGVNGLAPPERFSRLVDSVLLPEYFYELTIGRQVLSSNRDGIDSDVWKRTTVSLDDWAMTLDVFFPSNLYWQRLPTLVPFMVIAWAVLFFVFYAGHLVSVYYRRSLRHCVRRAIKSGTLDVYFQPIVSLSTSKAPEMEALLRWRSAHHGQVSPLVIVNIAEQLDVMDELTWLVIRKVGAFYREYPEVLSGINTAVNVDRFSLLRENFAPTLAGILEEYPELKGKLGLEVTENSALNAQELPLMVSRFEHLKVLGVGLSVDDFGTGYSGLDFLRRFPYDTLKLDQIFIANIDDPFTRQVLTSVTQLAKELGMDLVAEGVERQDQLDAVKALGVDKVQGYYFSQPLPKDQVIAWVERHCRNVSPA